MGKSINVVNECYLSPSFVISFNDASLPYTHRHEVVQKQGRRVLAVVQRQYNSVVHTFHQLSRAVVCKVNIQSGSHCVVCVPTSECNMKEACKCGATSAQSWAVLPCSFPPSPGTNNTASCSSRVEYRWSGWCMSCSPLSLPSDAMPHSQSGAKSVVMWKLRSRWGLDPVVIHDDNDDREQRTTLPNEDEDEDEPTGRVIWDCAQILWDLVADPNPGNEYAVRGKVGHRCRPGCLG